MLVRGALVLIAALAIVFGATRLHDARTCSDAKREAFSAALHGDARAVAEGLARRVADHCRASSDLAATAVVLARDRAFGPADRLVREAVGRDPRDYLGWVALAIVRRTEGRGAASRAAARRALALNPRYAAARQLASPARGAGAASP